MEKELEQSSGIAMPINEPGQLREELSHKCNNNIVERNPMDHSPGVKQENEKSCYIEKLKKESPPFTGLLNSTIDHVKDDTDLGFLIRLLRLPEDWEIHPVSLSEKFNISRKQFQRRFSRLVKLGLAEIKKPRDKNGKWIKGEKADYFVYQTPRTIIDKPLDKKCPPHKEQEDSPEDKKPPVDKSPPTNKHYSLTKNDSSNLKSRSGTKKPPIGEVGDESPEGRTTKPPKGELGGRPLVELTKAQRGLAYGITKNHIRPLHYDNCKVNFDEATTVNYVSRGILEGFSPEQIVIYYGIALEECHKHATDNSGAWENSSTVKRAYEKLQSIDNLTAADRLYQRRLKGYETQSNPNADNFFMNESDMAAFLAEQNKIK